MPTYPVDLIYAIPDHSFLPLGQDAPEGPYYAPCPIFVNSSGTRIVFGWLDDLPTGLSAITSDDFGQTWTLADLAGASTETARYARVCPHPTNANIVCVAYQHNGYGVDPPPSPGVEYDPTEIYVIEFNIETLTWGSTYGGLLPTGVRKSAVLKGIGARLSDLVLAVVSYATTGFVAHFLELSLTTGWGSAYQCAPVTPSIGYYPSQVINAGGLVTDGNNNCHVFVVDGNTDPGILNHCVLYSPEHPTTPNTVLTTLVMTAGWDELYDCNLVWHPSGVLFGNALVPNDGVSQMASGYLWDADTMAGTGFSFNLDEMWEAGRPTGYVVGNRIYLFLEAGIPQYKYLTYDPTRFTGANRGDLHIIQNVEDLFPSSNFWDGYGSTYYYRTMPEAGRVAGIFGGLNGQFYFEQGASPIGGYAHFGRGLPTTSGPDTKGYSFFG